MENNFNIDNNTMNQIKNLVDNGNISDALSKISPEMIQNFSKMFSQSNNSNNNQNSNSQNNNFESQENKGNQNNKSKCIMAVWARAICFEPNTLIKTTKITIAILIALPIQLELLRPVN